MLKFIEALYYRYTAHTKSTNPEIKYHKALRILAIAGTGNWIKALFSGRTQVVKVNGEDSISAPVYCVPGYVTNLCHN